MLDLEAKLRSAYEPSDQSAQSLSSVLAWSIQEYFYSNSSLDGMLVHCIKFAGTRVFTWVERAVRAKCLAQRRNNKLSPARNQAAIIMVEVFRKKENN